MAGSENEPEQFHFRSRLIDPEKVDSLAESRGFEDRSAFLRALIREEAQRRGQEVHRDDVEASQVA